MLAIDYKTYMVDDILTKVDRATMSLEGREPLLDYRLIEFVSQLPSNLKYRDGDKKWLLKQITHKYLPKKMMDRPKQGFGVPLTEWFRDELKEYFMVYLDEKRVEKEGLFNSKEIIKLRDSYLSGSKENVQKLWFLLMFEMDVKKIAIFVNSLESGGAERVISNLWAEEYECYLILIHNYKFYELDKIISLDEPKELSGFVKLLRLPILAYKLSNIIKFDNMISFLTRANYVNVLSNIFIKHQTIINERAMPSLQYQYGLNGKINRFLIKYLYPKADLCLSNSYGNMINLKNNFNVIKLAYIHNPFNLEMIEKMSKEEIEKKIYFCYGGKT